MPRPTRIEYSGAFYHVMNRGRGRQNIFHGSKYFLSFLDCLFESHQKFGAIIHAYCLMSNHYHLILETPHGNLSRIMQHINGVYTQRYNRLKKTDGTLFRGRFKAILVDEDEYLLNLNKYIHLNPIKLIKRLEDYGWSSYPAYLDKVPTPKWLNKSRTLEMITENSKDYKSYIEEMDEEDANFNFIKNFYSKKIIPAVMGDKSFKKKLYEKVVDLNSKDRNNIKKKLNDHVTTDSVVRAVSKVFKIPEQVILNRQNGRAKNNFPRKLAMYLCQTYTDNSLSKTQKIFNLTSVGAVSKAIYCVRSEISNNNYKKELEEVKNDLWFME